MKQEHEENIKHPERVVQPGIAFLFPSNSLVLNVCKSKAIPKDDLANVTQNINVDMSNLRETTNQGYKKKVHQLKEVFFCKSR